MIDKKLKEIYLAGGCFWGLEKYFSLLTGVVSTEVGYANGNKNNPTYDEVCNGSGHAETVKLLYDAEIVSLKKILQLYFDVIDPTLKNRQGNDFGLQYRTGVYYTDENDLAVISAIFEEKANNYSKPILTEVLPLNEFYKAEEYHQKYLVKNPGGYCHIGKDKFDINKINGR
ncbi:MAG: peptide-methionine (S)-S-oxide reductase MsrA [Candidatus Riflebacteria bacterium]|nr:peptide-methionine (S)-S-oxide reductase MsrA [Candidatus Riflebacteria bacterium]